jgi:hypothetical protein
METIMTIDIGFNKGGVNLPKTADYYEAITKQREMYLQQKAAEAAKPPIRNPRNRTHYDE